MKKSVYSLVLMDDVIEAVDQLAYRMHTSRSNLINQILAQQLAVTTPEMQMKNVFDTVEELLGSYQHFQIQQQAADSMISIKSVLRYKYNPTIRYAINLNRNQDENIGELKLISRSQSDVLQKAINTFIEFWSACEKQHALTGWQLDTTGKWSRTLQARTKQLEEAEIAQAIAYYIRMVDQGLKIHFEYIHEPTQAKIYLQKHFHNFLNENKIIL